LNSKSRVQALIETDYRKGGKRIRTVIGNRRKTLLRSEVKKRCTPMHFLLTTVSPMNTLMRS
jgi:predicted transcriptional regulator